MTTAMLDNFFINSAFAFWVLCVSYTTTMMASDMRDRGTLTIFWIIILAPLTVVGYVLDILLNITVGTVCYRFELPKLLSLELTFSQRVQRHERFDDRDSSDYRWTVRWTKILNAVQANHIRPRESY